ncbi:PREDICTED: DDB1- and CUL4-associated factor 8-like protein 2, partial [Cyphomyrmex costatus]|uniref:DDB1- and CUL4-associated factor 8-like protein 2 n=1 Tax=Cyphomyrmex costatus TaxID=456900 RepID=UPI0008522C4B
GFFVSDLNFNQKGNLLASAYGKTVSIWDWAARKKRFCIPSGHNNVRKAKWLLLDVENFMVTSGWDGCIRLLDLEYNSSRQLMNYASSFRPNRMDMANGYWELAVHPDIPYVVFSALKDSILSIDIREYKPNNEFCVSGEFPSVRVYDQRNISKPLYQLWITKYNKKDHDAFALVTKYNHDGTEILTLCNCYEILLFEKSMWSCEGNSNHTLFERSQFGSVGVYLCLGHPHIPILATASESNIQIWMPSSNEDPTESKFKTLNYSIDDYYHGSDSSNDSYNQSENIHVRGDSESP